MVKDEHEVVAEKVQAERERVLNTLKQTDTYTQLLDPLIDSYTETFRVYITMYDRWAAEGFPETEEHTNKAGATNEMKHPLAGLVDTWSEKRLKILERLGMTNKALSKKVITGGTTINTTTHEAEQSPNGEIDELAAHRQKWRRVNGD